jgi:hypothetical protein
MSAPEGLHQTGVRLFSSVEELQTALLGRDPKSFVSYHIIEPVPFAFHGDYENWVAWKELLASLLEIDPYDIVMTGSGSIGYSLNPNKDFRPFNDQSDIDCGIVNEHFFNVAWRHLRQSQVSWLSYPKKLKTALTSHKNLYIFDGTIATDRIMSILPFGQDWQSALDMMSDVPPTAGRDVKLRIYKDFDALRHYQSKNIQMLRDNISPAWLEVSAPEDEVLEEVIQ